MAESVGSLVTLTPVTSTALGACIFFPIFYIIYRSYFDPLSDVPGPLICRLTILWAWYHSFIGDESRQIDALHENYGPVVRIGPQDVVISDGKALAPIYTEKGGMLKAGCYSNFDFEGHATIFSSLDPKHRSVRSKAIISMFSTSNLRENASALQGCVDRFIARLESEAEQSRRAAQKSGKGSPVNVLNLARGLAIDAVSAYLFGKTYGGIAEETGKLSASSYVDSVVFFGGIFFLPKYLFDPIQQLSTWLWPSAEGEESEKRVADFTRACIEQSTGDDNTYQSRLLKAGISEHETDVQMKDVIFAGTDTTGTNLGKLTWQLAKYPHVYTKLRAEIKRAEQENPDYDPQQLEYLQAVIREGLRTSFANPTRLPRQIPPSGLLYTASDGKAYRMPAGTQVGLSPKTLHLNPNVFPEPTKFEPERWINDPTPEMQRDWIPFGLGPRQCIARNLAMMELTLAVRSLATSNVLGGARPVQDDIEILEWFNAKVVGERIDVVWE